MNKKKKFVAPRVVQEVQICLEKGCLLARSNGDEIVATGDMYYEDTDYTPEDQVWD